MLNLYLQPLLFNSILIMHFYGLFIFTSLFINHKWIRQIYFTHQLHLKLYFPLELRYFQLHLGYPIAKLQLFAKQLTQRPHLYFRHWKLALSSRYQLLHLRYCSLLFIHHLSLQYLILQFFVSLRLYFPHSV